MCRHKGIGMNRPKKTKVFVPELIKVKDILLRGHAVEQYPDLEPEPEQPPPVRACASPGKLVVQHKQKLAKAAMWQYQGAEARLRKANTTYNRAEALFKGREFALDHARPSKVVSVLYKRAFKSCDAVRDIIMAELDFYKVALEAEQCKSIWQNARAEAEKAAKSRLARKLRDAKSA